jgi:hypothetical protein
MCRHLVTKVTQTRQRYKQRRHCRTSGLNREEHGTDLSHASSVGDLRRRAIKPDPALADAIHRDSLLKGMKSEKIPGDGMPIPKARQPSLAIAL